MISVLHLVHHQAQLLCGAGGQVQAGTRRFTYPRPEALPAPECRPPCLRVVGGRACGLWTLFNVVGIGHTP